MVSEIDWEHLRQPDFDRIVEALFTEGNADLPEDAYVVNGGGGDGGIDIHIRRDGRLTIVQLKSFPERFSKGFAARRAQIKRSFQSTLAHGPDEWWLVVPVALTPGERKFVEELPQQHSATLRKPRVLMFGRPELDRLASKHPELVDYFMRDRKTEKAKVEGPERGPRAECSRLSQGRGVVCGGIPVGR